MDQIILSLNQDEKKKLKTLSKLVAVAVAVFAFLVFWAGVNCLRESLFKNYFNPSRHIIVEQDPDTMEIYTWADVSGKLYDKNNRDVQLFPYGVMLLLLLVLGLAMESYNLLVEHYAFRLYLQHQAIDLPKPGKKTAGKLIQRAS